LLDLSQSFGEELVKACSERGIVGGYGGQYTRMVERGIQPALQLPHARHNAGVHERIEIAIARNLFPQRIKVAQQLHVFLRKRGHVGIGKNFD